MADVGRLDSPTNVQKLRAARSLPSLGSAKSNVEGIPGGLFKVVSPTEGLDAAGRKSSWRGESEESRAQEVCRHLEWAAGMKAAYEQQMELCQQELHLLRSPSQQQTPHGMRQRSQTEAATIIQKSESCPELGHQQARRHKQRRPAHFSRRTHEEETIYLKKKTEPAGAAEHVS